MQSWTFLVNSFLSIVYTFTAYTATPAERLIRRARVKFHALAGIGTRVILLPSGAGFLYGKMLAYFFGDRTLILSEQYSYLIKF